MTDEFNVPSISYTSRDYRSLLSDAIARIPFFTSEWTDHTDSDPGMVLLQLFAGMHDVNHFYLDNKVRENIITEVRGRRSLIGLGALVGVRIKGKAPSAVDLDFTLQVAQANPTTIPVGTLCSTVGFSPAVLFETTEEVIIPVGTLTVTGVQAIAGQTVNSSLGLSDGTAFQEFLINTAGDVLDDGITVSVDGVEWTFTDNLILEDPDAQVWTYRRDELGQVFIMFGDGTVSGGNGKIPDSPLDVTASWREGGGVLTNVGAGSIRTVVSTILSGGNPVSIACNNPKVARGGDEEELTSLARKRVPRLYRSNNRAVNDQDYEALSESIPGVVSAHALVSGINRWTVYIAPHPSVGVGTGTDPFGYTVLGTAEQSQDALAQLVKQRLNPKTMGTDFVDVLVVNFRPIDIQVDITLDVGADRAKAEFDLGVFLLTFFDIRALKIGRSSNNESYAHTSDFENGVRDLDGVLRASSSKFQLRPQIETVQAIGQPVFSTIGYTPFTRDSIWEILFLDSLTYRVYRKGLTDTVSVLQNQIGSIGATFVDDKGEIELVITVPGGAISPQSGDRFRFRSSQQRGTVPILSGEIAAQGTVNFTLQGGV